MELHFVVQVREDDKWVCLGASGHSLNTSSLIHYDIESCPYL